MISFITSSGLDWGLWLDWLALAASLGLIMVLFFNRRRCGHLLIPHPAKAEGFQFEMARQMLNQHSRQALVRLQQVLEEELDSLPHTGGAGDSADSSLAMHSSGGFAPVGHQSPCDDWRQSQSLAARMLGQGRSTQEVAVACKLPLSAVCLIRYIQHKSKTV